MGKYDYPKGTTAVLTTQIKPIEIISESVKSTTEEPMDTA